MNARDVLSPGAGIPELRWALRGAAPKRALKGAVQNLLADGAVLRACRLRRVELKTRRQLPGQYNTWVPSESSPVGLPNVAVLGPGEGGPPPQTPRPPGG